MCSLTPASFKTNKQDLDHLRSIRGVHELCPTRHYLGSAPILDAILNFEMLRSKFSLPASLIMDHLKLQNQVRKILSRTSRGSSQKSGLAPRLLVSSNIHPSFIFISVMKRCFMVQCHFSCQVSSSKGFV